MISWRDARSWRFEIEIVYWIGTWNMCVSLVVAHFSY
jgi:hypothetical protein